ncbi:MAG: 16S rRNA (cytidine(1402)-2'-O)-methyltransferase [Alphaproteobacteria bacterium]|nr:16S rRNA (cytidine(1402)-2'-O)-methyltransferase [Alphaproteobacteria bacterium]
MDHTNEKKRAWLLPALTKTKLSPGLYLVATPIGNLGDITVRALDTLAAADVVLCEDTRVSGKLMSAYGLSKKLMTYNDHATQDLRDKVVRMIGEGQVVALISDAGTPLISDPGYKLVQACQGGNVPVTTLPGANAPLSALQLSGMPIDAFCFIGFLPAKSMARQAMLRQWAHIDGTLIAFESAQRLQKTLVDIKDVLGARKVAVIREITKLYEQYRIDGVSALIDHYAQNGAPKGEIVLVIEPPHNEAVDEDGVRAALAKALLTMSTKEAANFVAEQTGWAKKAVYALALEVKNDQ